MREEQMRLRAEREKERQEYERAEKERKAAEEGTFCWLIFDVLFLMTSFLFLFSRP